ncbi:MAG: hypothetical protein JSV65_05460 [Armatimonadota bacterium]|nr:MAG: hypothetical protein JSV65_05460 [Armatimonadota bacterium]
MREARARFSSIGGALVAIAIVLALAIHLTQQIGGTVATPSLAAVGLGAHEVPGAPDMRPVARLLDQTNATDEGRPRILAYAAVSRPTDEQFTQLELTRLADSIQRKDPGVSAVAILAYSSEAEREALGENAPWVLVWSPDGLGWDGLGQNDFDKHITYTPAE